MGFISERVKRNTPRVPVDMVPTTSQPGQHVEIKRSEMPRPTEPELYGPRRELGPTEVNIGAAPPPQAIVLDTETGETRRDQYVGTMPMMPSHEVAHYTGPTRTQQLPYNPSLIDNAAARWDFVGPLPEKDSTVVKRVGRWVGNVMDIMRPEFEEYYKTTGHRKPRFLSPGAIEPPDFSPQARQEAKARFMGMIGAFGFGFIDFLREMGGQWPSVADTAYEDWTGVNLRMANRMGVHSDDIPYNLGPYFVGSLLPWMVAWPMLMKQASNLSMSGYLFDVFGLGSEVDTSTKLGKAEVGIKGMVTLDFIMKALPGAARYGMAAIGAAGLSGKALVDKVVTGYKRMIGKMKGPWKTRAREIMEESLKATDIPQAERNAILEAFGEGGGFNMSEWRAIVSGSVKNPGDRDVLIKTGNEIFAGTLPEISSAIPSMNAAFRLERARQLVKKGVTAENAMTKVTVDKAKSLGVAGIGDKVKLKGKVWQIGGATKRGYILHKGKQKINISADRLSKLQVVK